MPSMYTSLADHVASTFPPDAPIAKVAPAPVARCWMPSSPIRVPPFTVKELAKLYVVETAPGLNQRVAPGLMATAPAPNPVAFSFALSPTCTMPELIVKPPEKLFAPAKIRVPVPLFINGCAPDTTPTNESFCLEATFQVWLWPRATSQFAVNPHLGFGPETSIPDDPSVKVLPESIVIQTFESRFAIWAPSQLRFAPNSVVLVPVAPSHRAVSPNPGTIPPVQLVVVLRLS